MLTALAINAVLVGLLVGALLFVPKLLAPASRMQGEKGLPFETGMRPLEPRVHAMWASYYRLAVLFVIFDVDLAFLVPWVLLRHQLTLDAMIAMSAFMGSVGLTLAYVWRKGCLKI